MLKQMHVTIEALCSPPEWLAGAFEYLKSYAKEEALTPQTLARRWDARLGRRRELRLSIARALVRREIYSFKELTQGEIKALAEVCRWVESPGDSDERDASGRVLRSGPQGAAHPAP